MIKGAEFRSIDFSKFFSIFIMYISGEAKLWYKTCIFHKNSIINIYTFFETIILLQKFINFYMYIKYVWNHNIYFERLYTSNNLISSDMYAR